MFFMLPSLTAMTFQLCKEKKKATTFHASKSAVDQSTHGIIVKKINIVTGAL